MTRIAAINKAECTWFGVIFIIWLIEKELGAQIASAHM